jgi:hypothetical protein
MDHPKSFDGLVRRLLRAVVSSDASTWCLVDIRLPRVMGKLIVIVCRFHDVIAWVGERLRTYFIGGTLWNDVSNWLTKYIIYLFCIQKSFPAKFCSSISKSWNLFFAGKLGVNITRAIRAWADWVPFKTPWGAQEHLQDVDILIWDSGADRGSKIS